MKKFINWFKGLSDVELFCGIAAVITVCFLPLIIFCLFVRWSWHRITKKTDKPFSQTKFEW